MKYNARITSATSLLCAVTIVLLGCGDAAPSKAPTATGPPHKKWADLTKDEKLKVIDSQPIPNKERLKELVMEGKK